MNKNDISAYAAKAKNGDKEAFEKLYREFYAKVYYFAKQNTGDADAAEDITAETFTLAMENIGTLRSEESFVGWLYCIAYHKCSDHLKKLTLDRKQLEQTAGIAALSEPLMLPDDYAINAQTREQLRAVINSLPTDMRSAVILYYYDGLSVGEVAEVIGTNPNNAKQKLFSARKKIKKQIEKLIGKGSLFSAVPLSAVLANLEGAGLLSGAAVGTAAAVGAAAVGVPVALSRLSGGTAKELTRFTFKYWRRHKKSLAALLFSGVLLCAVVCCAFLMIRASFNRSLHREYDHWGRYQYAIPQASDELLSKICDDKTQLGKINIYGRIKAGDREFEYGALDDGYGLAHIPFDSGRLPESSDEIAIEKSVLKEMGYAGKVGDHITLDIGTFRLSGIISEIYGTQRPTANGYGKPADFKLRFALPLVYLTPLDKTPIYSFTMIRNACIGWEDGLADLIYKYKSDEIDEANEPYMSSGCGEEEGWLEQSMVYRTPERLKAYIFSGIAVIIAVLSVIAVTRNIFIERRSTLQMLRRIGLSRRRLNVMYAIECIILSAVQTLIGTALGVGAYIGIYSFEVNALEQTPYSGLTSDRLVTDYTVDPFFAAIAFSVLILPVGYLFTALLSKLTRQSRRRGKAASLFRCFAKVFRSRTVTVIQVMALSLICFATLFGYIIFTDRGKSWLMDGVDRQPDIIDSFSEGLTFEDDGLEEYYSTVSASGYGFGDLFISQPSRHINGTTDETADKLDAMSTGTVNNTFIVGDKDTTLPGQIVLGTQQETEALMQHITPQAKEYLQKNRYLFAVQTKLADKKTIEMLSQYVVSGKIDTERIAKGEQAVFVTRSDSPFKAGDSITVGSAQGTDTASQTEYIKCITDKKTTIGAVVCLPDDAERVLRYCVLGGLISSPDKPAINHCLLTTADGARALGLNDAVYTEIFSKVRLDGGLIPMNANMQLLSYTQEKRKLRIAKLTQFGSTALMIVLMSLLGFAAYFNGIGMKIRMKEYQLSVMRAIGTPLKKLRRRLLLDSIRIPIAAAGISLAAIKLVQHINLLNYKKMLEIFEKSLKTDPLLTLQQNCEIQSALNTQAQEMRNVHLINDEMWVVKVLIPAMIVLAVMLAVTAVLTRRSVSRLDDNIAYSISRGRKRR